MRNYSTEKKESMYTVVKLLKQSNEGTIQLVIDYEKPKQTYTITKSCKYITTHFDNDTKN